MKKLKIVLLFSFIVFFYVLIITHKNHFKTKYFDEKIINGYINYIKENNDKTKIELIGKEKIIVNYKDKINYKLGDYIEVYGTLSTPSNNTNFNLFNYNKYLKSKKIYHIFNADKIIKIKSNNKIRYKIKNKIIKRLKKINNKYLYTFILGDSNYLDDNIKLSFRNNGISHLFAVSGMHITLLSMLLLKILSKIKNKYIINLTLFSFLLFYMFLTNFTPSVIRATFLFISLSINKLFNLKLNPLICILLILDIMLIYNPYYIYNIGFILSFLVSISLILFGKISNNYHNYFIKILMTSIISFLISIPVVINNNYEINLLTPFINVIFVPLISLIIFPLSLLTFIIPIFNPILNILINIFEYLSLLVDKIDMFMITLKKIDIIYFIFYYLLILFVIKKLLRKNHKYLLLIIIALLIHNNINYLNYNTFITMLDVGQGDSILIELPHNNNILIDTGGNYNYDLSSNVIIPYLKSRGINKLKYLILTHGDYDHMGEAINLVNRIKVSKVIFNCGKYNSLEKKLIKVLNKKHIKYDTCINQLDNMTFLQTKDFGNENDNSNVIYMKINGYKFVFTGDASITTETEIIKKYSIEDIDVLKVGHHGSRTSSGINFIKKMNPKYSLISVGLNNKFKHPNKETLDNLSDSKIYRTDQDGSIMFKINNNKLNIETCSP